MKRKVLWVSSLAVWFLIFSTFFSLRVEQLMLPLVTECAPTFSRDSTTARLPLDCLFPGEGGAPVLYQTYEGLGWDSGLRVTLAPPNGYAVEAESVASSLDRVVQYASKGIIPGERVALAGDVEPRQDLYLAVCPTGVRLREDLPSHITLLAQTGHSVLAAAEQAPGVFFPKQAAGELFQQQPFTPPDQRVYSLVEVERFFSALPLAALLPGMLLLAVLLWGASYPLLASGKKYRRQLRFHGCLGVVALAALPLILSRLELPSSLLPQSCIVDFSHYAEEFTEVFSALKELAGNGLVQAQHTLGHCRAMLWSSLGVVALCLLLGAAFLAVEKRARSPKTRGPGCSP